MDKENLRILLFTIFYMLIIKSGYIKWMGIWVVDPVIIGLIGIVVLYFFRPKPLSVKNNIQFVLLTIMVLIGWILFSCIYTSSPDVYKLKFIKTMLVFSLFYIPFLLTHKSDDFKYIIPAYNIFGLIGALIVLWLYVTDGLNIITTNSDEGTLVPNYLSLSMIFSSTLVLNLPKTDLLNNLFKLLLFVCIIIMGGRMPFLIVSFMVVGYYLIKYRTSFQKILLFGCIVFACGAAFLSWKGSARITERFESINSVGGNRSYNLRNYFIKVSVKQIMEKPLFGTGYGSFSKEISGKDEINTPHSLFLELGFETGIPGMIIVVVFFILMYGLIKNIIHQPPGDQKDKMLRFSFVVIYYFLTSILSLYLMNSKELFAFSGCFLALYNAQQHELKNVEKVLVEAE